MDIGAVDPRSWRSPCTCGDVHFTHVERFWTLEDCLTSGENSLVFSSVLMCKYLMALISILSILGILWCMWQTQENAFMWTSLIPLEETVKRTFRDLDTNSKLAPRNQYWRCGLHPHCLGNSHCSHFLSKVNYKQAWFISWETLIGLSPEKLLIEVVITWWHVDMGTR